MDLSLNYNTIGEAFIEIATIESTNNYAMGQLQNGAAKHGTAWFAHEQTAGKGQRGKQWMTRPSENIILSVALDCSAWPLNEQFRLSVTVALGAFDLFSKYAGDETKIKWPNDIYWRDRKAAGILIENIVQGRNWQWAVAGIGMNIQQHEFPDLPTKPVSLKQITGRTFDPVELAKELCGMLQDRWIRSMNDPEGQLKEYNDRLFRKNEWTKLNKDNRVFEAKILGVDTYGQLICFTHTEERFGFGEVEWII